MSFKNSYKNILKAIELRNELIDSINNLYKLQNKVQRETFLEIMEDFLTHDEPASSLIEEYIEYLEDFDIPIPECLTIKDEKELQSDLEFILSIYASKFKNDYVPLQGL